jgi:hypothetical protein
MFMVVLAGGTVLESTAVMKYLDRSRSDFRERESMKRLLDEMVGRFEDLIVMDVDDEQNQVLENIRHEYSSYGLTIKDISSGCNLNFFPDTVLSDTSLADFLFASNADGFLQFRRNHGFVRDSSVWKTFLKEEALNSVVCYGWFSPAHADSETGRMLAASLGRQGEGLYPVMNDMPLININTIDTALLGPLLSSRFLGIDNAAVKATALKNRLEYGPVTERELQSMLGLRETHEVYQYLGVRTTFWALSFKNEQYRMDAVIAAVPERGSRIIERYILIEGIVSREV